MSILRFVIILLIFYFGFDIYTFYGLNILTDAQSIFCSIYWSVSLLVLVGFVLVYRDLQSSKGEVRSKWTNLILGFGFAVFVGKILFSGMMIFQDLGRYLLAGFSGLMGNSQGVPDRSYYLTLGIGVLAGIPFVSMLYGMTVGKYRYVVDSVKLRFEDLPEAFDGFKVAQISDIHSGTFDSVEQVQKGVEMIVEQKPDIILFTGDLVNSNKDEINPYIKAFSLLEAPLGLYSVMGNHDYYGLYSLPKGDELAKDLYMKNFYYKHQQMGFQIMNNTSVKLNKGGDSIRLVGVENWGAGPFPKKGDLDRALYGVEQDEFTILMSHDPTHWDHKVLKHKKHIHLTLAGHTHGMQFGVNILGLKWSPVKYRYKRWIGLYKELGQYLYVNRGFGFLAWPGRVGMRPEITLIELGRK